jgi:N-acetylglucosamine-6-phosphate deacetylase
MPNEFSLDGSILTPAGWVRGSVAVQDGRIGAVNGSMLKPGEQPMAPFILPGFVDPHVHGGGGFDCLEGVDATRGMVEFHARNGTVAILPTTSTAPAEIVEGSLRNIAAVMADQDPKSAEILGAHLEGPFLSEHRLGAQESRPLAGDVSLVNRWAAICPIMVATVAPEIEGGLDVGRALAANGTRVQVGHSIADDDVLRQAFAAGFTGYTHLFNAMTPVDHKVSGIAAFALAFATHAEIVGDLRHVHPTVVMAAYRAIPLLYAVTDAVGVAGLPDGEHITRGGRRTIIKTGLDIFLKDRPQTRGGSGATMHAVFRSLLSLGIPMDIVSAMTSTRAADYIGATDLGRIQPGKKASIVTLGENYELTQVHINGVAVLPQ